MVMCCVSTSLLCGCAGMAAVIVSQAAAAALLVGAGASPQDLAATGVDDSPIDYPIAAVYRGLTSVAEADGRKIVATDREAYTLRISYPFSLARNNWGDEITVTCVVDGAGTRMLFADDGHDAPARVQKIEAKLRSDTVNWLRQHAQHF